MGEVNDWMRGAGGKGAMEGSFDYQNSRMFSNCSGVFIIIRVAGRFISFARQLLRQFSGEMGRQGERFGYPIETGRRETPPSVVPC